MSPDLFSTDPVSVVITQSTRFRPNFADWIRDNMHVWRAFEREANRIWERGRRHYSARTIGEFLRHETALREDGDDFKLNDHAWPDLARLYLLIHPDRQLFELRGERKAV